MESESEMNNKENSQINLINENNRMFGFLKKAFFPKTIIFSSLNNYLKTIENKKCFLICSKSFLDNNPDCTTNLEVVDKYILSGEPSINTLKECVDKINQITEELFIIGIGGGSVVDLAKAVKKECNKQLIVIPTTPATGSEVTPFSVFVDQEEEKKEEERERENKKTIINSQKLLPDVVILDPSYQKTIPKELHGYMVGDILAHSIEAFLSKFSNPLSDVLALQSIKLIDHTLSIDDYNKNIDKFWEKIQIAGLLAGQAQGMAATGLVHSFAHQFGAKYKIPHSKAVTIFLKDVIKLNLDNYDVNEKMSNLGYLKPEDLISVIEKHQRLFNLQNDKMRIKVNNDFNMEECINKIKRDVCSATNPFRANDEQIKEIIEKHIEN